MVRFWYLGDRSFKAALTELQEAFAGKQLSDELKRMERRRRRNETHITRYRGDPIIVRQLLVMKLRIDGDLTHGRPHLHIEYGGNFHKASYAIDTGERLAGKLDRKYDKLVREWIERNRAEVTKAWKDITSGRDASELVAQLKKAD